MSSASQYAPIPTKDEEEELGAIFKTDTGSGPRKWNSRAGLILAVLAATSAVAGVVVATKSKAAPAPTLGARADSASLSSATSAVQLTVTNSQYSTAPSSLHDYGWAHIVEPGRANELTLSGDSVDRAVWAVVDVDGSATASKAIQGTVGSTATYTPTEDDAGRLLKVRVNVEGKTVDFDVAVKYVRREFRKLAESDREAYFSALSTIYKVGTLEGKLTYGNAYRGHEYFAKKHLAADTLEGCTPWHDSPVFLTAHSAFNLEFEKVLRAIDPSLSAHYWEYSIDDEEYGKYWNEKSPLFTDDFFGAYAEADEDQYLRGYFKGVEMAKCDADPNDSDDGCPEHSIFGHLIDANSYQKPSLVQRSKSACGMPTKSKLPGCKFVEKALSSSNVYDFWENVELRYHGDSHALIGGVTGCKYQVPEELSGYSDDSKVMQYAGDITMYMVAWGRSLFSDDKKTLGPTAGTASCPHNRVQCTEEIDCTCSLPTVTKAIEDGTFDLSMAVSVLQETGYFNDLAGATGWATKYIADYDDVTTDDVDSLFADLTATENEDLVIFLAKQSSYQPRDINPFALSLGSTNDPVFWPAHNSWERMWASIRIEEVRETHEIPDANWTDFYLDGRESRSTVTCDWSQSIESTLPFFNLMKDEEVGETSYYTNLDLMRMLSPKNIRLPHVYDSLAYSQCDASSSTAAASSSPPLTASEVNEDYHAEFRFSLMKSARTRGSAMYEHRKSAMNDDDKAKLNKFYDWMFSDPTVKGYEKRPRF